MKIDTQTIPPELAAAYAKLVSRKPTLAGPAFVARTKPAAHKPVGRKIKRKELRDIEGAVDFLIAYLTLTTGTPPAATFRAAQIDNLKRGIFDTLYWQQCSVDSTDMLSASPTFTAWVGPRAYAYPDPLNQPSTPVYGAGTASAGNEAYTGITAGGTFSDTLLRWKRTVLSLLNPFARSQAEPLFVKIVGTITATADQRPSRAMISIVIKHWLTLGSSTRLTTTEAPVVKPKSAYWRYITPRGVAPYFNLTKNIQLVYWLRGIDYEELGGDLTKCVLLTAPMPMMGKRFNNNTAISTSLTSTIELWQIKKGYRGWLALNYLMDATGALTAYTHPAWLYPIFTDGTHGIVLNDASGPTPGNMKLISNSLTQTSFVAPWDTGIYLGRTYTVPMVQTATNGFTVFIIFDDDALLHLFEIDTSGTLVRHTDETISPDIPSIIYTYGPANFWSPVISRYAQDWTSSGIGAVVLSDLNGTYTSQVNYDSMTPYEQIIGVCEGATGAAVLTRTNTFPDQWWAIWEQTDAGTTLIGTFIDNAANTFKLAYHAGNYYCFPNSTTLPIQVMDSTGTMHQIAADSRVFMWAQVAWKYNWLGA